MNQRKGTNATTPFQRPREPQPPAPRPPSSQPQTPRVVQPKVAAPSPTRGTPAAPPVYRPQPAPIVAQAATPAASQPKVSPRSHAILQPKPAAHRNVLQPKPSSQPHKLPAAPPVYRPEPKRVVQPKAASPARTAPQAPPVYNPNPTPRVLQRKSLPGQPATPSATGRAALPQPTTPRPNAVQPKTAGPLGALAARRFAPPPRGRGVVQRLTDCGGEGEKEHISFGNFIKSDPKLELEEKKDVPVVPIIIELLETDPASAKKKVEQLVATGVHKIIPVAFVFAINAKLGKEHDNIKGYGSKLIGETLKKLADPCVELTKYMEGQGIAGGCFPLVWAPTSTKEGGYTFPFLECRSILTLHKGVQSVHKEMSAYKMAPVVRGMDADVRNDPLLNGVASHHLSVSKQDMGTSLLKGLAKIGMGELAVFSGGYEWDISDVTPQKLLALQVIEQDSLDKSGPLVGFLQSLIAIVNIKEMAVREELFKVNHKSVYWPEPNVYMSLDLRLTGAKQSLETAKKLKSGEAQQKESTQYVQSNMAHSGMFSSAVSTRKPLKTYFDDFIKYFAKAFAGEAAPSVSQIEMEVAKIRQTHLDIQKVQDILKWHDASNDFVIGKVTPIVQQHLRDCADAIHAVLTKPEHKPKPAKRVGVPVPKGIPTPQEMAKWMGL